MFRNSELTTEMVNISHNEIKNVLVVQVHVENVEPCQQRWKMSAAKSLILYV